MKKIPFLLVVLCIHLTIQAQSVNKHISIDFAQKGAEISPMYGLFFEEINHAGEGGLYAELLRNRSFEDNILVPGTTYQDGFMVSPHLLNYDSARYAKTGGYTDFKIKFDTSLLQGWELMLAGNARATYSQSATTPLYPTAPHSLALKIGSGNKQDKVSIVNSGFSGFIYDMKGKPYKYSAFNAPQDAPPYGIYFNKNESYNLRIIVKAGRDYKGSITAHMLDENGTVIGQQVFQVKKKNTWEEYKCQLRPDQTVAHGKFSLSFDATGTVWIDFVSLMPENTFNHRPNGLRKDMATMLANLKPAFLRWPGGCIVEGFTLENRFKWKGTVGDPAARHGEFNLWGYRNSYGFGYHEFLQYCEDIGADGMFVCNVGLSCLYRNGDYSSKEEVPNYIQEALDAIEYAIGDPGTKWGGKRAAAGHPAPFPLKYIEVGNENKLQEYNDRYDLFYKAIKAKYPQMVIISDFGIRDAEQYAGSGGAIEMIDPHFYERPDSFYKRHTMFDSVLPRPNYKMYVGEYSIVLDVGFGNLKGALSEAAFAMGMERNADLVKICSYAPLLQHDGDHTWAVNMIIFNTDTVYGRTSYYVQKMLSENRPDVNLNTILTNDTTGVGARHFSIAGYENKTNEIVIKVVNAGSTPLNTTIDLKNAGPLATDGTAIVLSAPSDKEENSFSVPEQVSPKTTTFTGVSGSFDYEFKPFSFTVLRIKRSKGS